MLASETLAKKKVFGTPNDRKIKATARWVENQINALEDEFLLLPTGRSKAKKQKSLRQAGKTMAGKPGRPAAGSLCKLP